MNDELEDLSALARRGELSELETRKLEKLLEASPEERIWHDLASRCDVEDVEDASEEDADATARVANKVLQGLPAQRLRRHRARFVWVAAASLLVVSAAAAGIMSVRRARQEPAPQVAPSASSATSKRRVPVHDSLRDESAPPHVDTPSDSKPASSGSGSTPLAVPSSPRVESVENTDVRTPADLLSAAGQARRRGDAKQAIEVLERLQARYPNSSEARASDITLGKLKLQNGAARPALTHFERYLKRSPQGALAPEALWGRAQALSSLGNQTEASRSLTELVQRYPNSPYASSANAKLRGSPPP